jgi:hypothetical protein
MEFISSILREVQHDLIYSSYRFPRTAQPKEPQSMNSQTTVCVVVRSDETFSMERDTAFGLRISQAIKAHKTTRKKQPVQIRQGSGIAAWVIGADIAEARQVYVLQEGTGERVTATEGSKAALDAMVDVLRSRGYTCIKRGGAE